MFINVEKSYMTSFFTDKPNIAVETSSLTVLEEVDVTLRCIVDANPPAEKLYWLHRGTIVKTVMYPPRNESRMFELVISTVRR